jgi:hypothetical protein
MGSMPDANGRLGPADNSLRKFTTRPQNAHPQAFSR